MTGKESKSRRVASKPRRPKRGRVLMNGVAFRVALARHSLLASDVSAKLGIPKATLSTWYKGSARAPIQKLLEIARLLKVPLDDLVSDEEAMIKPNPSEVVEQMTIDGHVEVIRPNENEDEDRGGKKAKRKRKP